MIKHFNKNKPALGDAFRSKEVKEYLQSLLKELSDAKTLKHFLTVGHEKYFEEEIDKLSNHFYPMEVDGENTNLYIKVKRCIDGTIFSVGDRVIDKLDPSGKVSPIGLMYEDERGLHIRLDLKPEGKLITITWRDLSRIEHDLPF